LEGYAEEEDHMEEEAAFENEGQRRTSKPSPKSYSSAGFSLDAKVPSDFRWNSLAMGNVSQEFVD
jgi:hypothetical protein